MSNFDESKVVRDKGKFANKDASLEEPGQVDLGNEPELDRSRLRPDIADDDLPTVAAGYRLLASHDGDFEDIPTKVTFPENIERGDVIVDKDMQMSFVMLEKPEAVQQEGRTVYRMETDQGTLYGGNGAYPIAMTTEEVAEEEGANQEWERERRIEVAQNISNQMEMGVKMALGSSNYRATDTGLAFNARMLAYRKDGTRGSRVSNNTVNVDLNASDYYDITVTDPKGNQVARTTDVDAGNLNRALLALDYDGDEPFNPRYWHGEG